jgi:hypothetical protein
VAVSTLAKITEQSAVAMSTHAKITEVAHPWQLNEVSSSPNL